MSELSDIAGIFVERFFDAQELIIFGDTFRAGETAAFDESAISRDAEICDEGIFGFADAVTDDGGQAVSLRDAYGVERFGQRANLIGFNNDAAGGGEIDTFFQQLRVRDEEVIAEDLDGTVGA